MKNGLIDKYIDRVNNGFSSSIAKGVLLLTMVVLAMLWANSSFGESYFHFFEMEFTIGFQDFSLTEPIHIWINDGLMAIFFFTVGLEIKREIISGELSQLKKALLPVVAALGGMILPAILFFIINHDSEASSAWGIPMATDIAFALGIVALAGNTISKNGKVFLTALATVDDVGAILVIALFLTPQIDFQSLIIGMIYLGIMVLANVVGIRNMWFYVVVGVLGLWIALLLSGIHATLAGVLGALTIPATRKVTELEYKTHLKSWIEDFEDSCTNDNSLLTPKQEEILHNISIESKRAGTPLQRVEHMLKPAVNFLILPLFALANAGVRITDDFFRMLFHPVSLGIIIGLVLGKVLGISVFSRILVKSGLSELPNQVTWKSIYGIGMMAGIGFTMSLFIAELALEDENLLSIAKIGILTASVISAFLGLLWFLKNKNFKER
ncbi:Na+/H+ antiporter NhaA [Aquimarina mytili]|uniref:Na(+)/H(+) antiporter NhaA n=1 Tax=Aquimarina mytili TaxID=874423 RepID=A0A937DBL7_9FLAO|nr:Na+/H+ antiporter NhaA [Aquimarina mytili]MBL0684748.1 Na+/H+ antiporter NhaA [Aquimarina mytili]